MAYAIHTIKATSHIQTHEQAYARHTIKAIRLRQKRHTAYARHTIKATSHSLDPWASLCKAYDQGNIEPWSTSLWKLYDQDNIPQTDPELSKTIPKTQNHANVILTHTGRVYCKWHESARVYPRHSDFLQATYEWISGLSSMICSDFIRASHW